MVKAGTGRRFLGGLLDDTSYCYTLEVSFYSYMTAGSTAPVPYTEETCILRHVCVCGEQQFHSVLSLFISPLSSHTNTHTHTHTQTVAAIAISFWNQANWSHYHWSYFFYIFVSLVVSVWVQMCQRVPVCVCVSSHVYSPENHVALLLPLVATDVRWQNRDVIAASIDFIYKGERRKGGLCWRM